MRFARAAAVRHAAPGHSKRVRATSPGCPDPIPVNLGQEEAIVLLMPLGAARVPEYAAVKDDLP